MKKKQSLQDKSYDLAETKLGPILMTAALPVVWGLDIAAELFSLRRDLVAELDLMVRGTSSDGLAPRGAPIWWETGLRGFWPAELI